MTKLIFSKKSLHLNEDNNGSKGTAYVEPSSDSTSSLATDINKTKQENPTDDTFVVNANSYDGNKSNNTVTLDINADNGQDATQQFTQMKQNPYVKNMIANGNVNARIHLKNEQIERLRENSVVFSKKEIKDMLK
jgi:GTPase SAR1 family protein